MYCIQTTVSVYGERSLTVFIFHSMSGNLYELSIKYQQFLKLTKMYTFGQKISLYHNPSYYRRKGKPFYTSGIYLQVGRSSHVCQWAIGWDYRRIRMIEVKSTSINAFIQQYLDITRGPSRAEPSSKRMISLRSLRTGSCKSSTNTRYGLPFRRDMGSNFGTSLHIRAVECSAYAECSP